MHARLRSPAWHGTSTSTPSTRSGARSVRSSDLVRDGGLVAYPTDSCFALGCQLGDRDGLDRIRTIRKLDDRHHFTLVCRDFAQLGQFVHVSNAVFRAVKAATPGSYTFILPATQRGAAPAAAPAEEDRGRAHPGPRRRAGDARRARRAAAVVARCCCPDDDEPLTQGWEIKEQLDHAVDAVVDSGDCGTEPTTVVDLSGDEPEIVRYGAGDPARFT